MDFRSLVDQVKSAFVIGKGNTYLHGGMPGRQEAQGQYEQQQNSAAQAAYAQNNQGYQSPYQQPANPYAPNQQGYPQAQQQGYAQAQQPEFYGQEQGQAYGYTQQQAATQGQLWQQTSAPAGQGFSQPYGQPQKQQLEPRQSAGYETQMDPNAQESGRNRRSRQHQESKQPDPVYTQQQAAAQNIVQFPGAAPQPAQEAGSSIDAYVINVFNINSCRQAMSCLRRGQCTLIVMDQLVDKAEIRRYVDMLTGACYALNGTMTRLSSNIGFYIMAPAAMTVYTDPTTSNANAP
ncbi:MAG: cell division protein SepF, partial [Clostridiales bacterium]|nr:cell division protein SepF [Clostridiales bacterium]